MTLLQRAKRYIYREITWQNVKESEEILAILDKLNAARKDFSVEVHDEFPDITKREFKYIPYDRREALESCLENMLMTR